MRATLRGIEAGTRVRYQGKPGGRREPGVVMKVDEDAGTVEVALDDHGVYLAPVTLAARTTWEKMARSISPGAAWVPKVETDQRAEALRRETL